MYAFIKQTVNVINIKEGCTKFATKSSSNEKTLKNQQFTFSFQNLQLLGL